MSEPTGTQYGGFWIRLLAFLADSAIVFLASAALLIGAAMALGPDGLMPAVFAVWLLGFLYWPVMHASRRQATFGKAIVGLNVSRFDGRRISILRSLWREVAKIFSAAVLMLGYLMAALTPRKQGLHDLMSATYVVREGPSRIIPALAVAIAGFALPVFVVPMVLDAATLSTLTSIAGGMVPQDLMKQIPGPAQDLVKQAVGPSGPATKAPPKAQAPAPTQAAPTQVAKAQSTPFVPVAEPAKQAVAEAAQPMVEPAKPTAVAAKRKAPAAKSEPTAARPVARAGRPAALPPSTSKAGSGPRYNDLMTAVIYRDTDGVNELLKLGKWADKPDSRGATPLMVAAELGDVRTAEALLRAGADARPAVPVAEDRRHGEMILLLKRYSGR
jgi:uncharacterized RDD family membrane protein YckC